MPRSFSLNFHQRSVAAPVAPRSAVSLKRNEFLFAHRERDTSMFRVRIAIQLLI